jgi:hypothetical protein
MVCRFGTRRAEYPLCFRTTLRAFVRHGLKSIREQVRHGLGHGHLALAIRTDFRRRRGSHAHFEAGHDVSFRPVCSGASTADAQMGPVIKLN